MNPLRSFLESRARSSPVVFAGLVGHDEQTGAPIQLATHHRKMHALWTAHDRVVTWGFAESGKTTQEILRIAWELGRNPTLRVNIVSGTLAQAERAARAVARLIESPAYQRVFPGVSIESEREGGFTLAGRPPSMKDPSVTPSGLGQGSVLGQRFDAVIGDDLLDLESTKTPAGREAAWTALVSVTLSRLAPGGRVWLAGTAWHVDDVLARAAKLSGWHSAAFPVLDEHGNPTWPARWPSERVEARRLELGPYAFARVMQCQPLDEASVVFRHDDIERALLQGVQPHFSPLGGRVVIGCDPAWTLGPNSDESGIVVVTIDSSGFRHLVHVEGLRLHHDALTSRVVELARANKATVYIESNGAGGVIADNIGKRVPCTPLNTSATSKRARVEALSAELASSRWAFRQPLGHPSPDLRKLVDELSMFSFDAHTGDRCSALLLACEGCRLFESRPRGGVRHLDLFARF